MSVFTLATLATVVEVIWISYSYLLRLISNETNAASHLRRDGALESALSEETVDSLNLVPPLLRRDFREVGSGFLHTSLIIKLNPDPVDSNVPIHESICILEVAKDRHRDMKTLQLIAGNWSKARILHCAGNSVFPQSIVKMHLIEGADTTPEFLFLANLPSDEERVLVIGE